MAENEKDEAKGQKVPNSPGEKNNTVKMVAIIAAVVVILCTGIAFGVAKFVLSTTGGGGGGVKTEGAAAAAGTQGTNFEAGEYTTNINSDDGGLRFAKVKLVFELSNEKLAEELTSKKPKVDDTIIDILRNKSFEELRQVNASPKLKKEIKDKVNLFLAEGRVENVFFTNFITQ